MKIKNIFACLLSCVMLASTSALALEHGAYKVTASTNYWNPETGEIDDGGTANAALGDGMCRSATATTALVEKDGDKYYVTIRLLLQSNTHSPEFWQKTGYNTYSPVKYQVMAENGVADSVDYRFEVNDPFAPIKASMYVVPMGRDVVWYIELSESSATTDTGDFVVLVKAPTKEEVLSTEPEDVIEELPEEFEEVVEETPKEEVIEESLEIESEVEELKEEAKEEVKEEKVELEEIEEVIEEEPDTEILIEETLLEVEPSDEIQETEETEEIEDTLEEENLEEVDAVASASFKITNYTTEIVIGLAIASAVIGFVVYKRKKK